MDIVKHNTNIDFLKYKAPAFIISLLIIIAGLISIQLKGGLRYGVDFSGGIALYTKFRTTAPLDAIRQALNSAGFKDSGVQGFVDPTEVLIRIPQNVTSGENVDQIRRKVISALNQSVLKSSTDPNKMDLNDASASQITQYLQTKDPLGGQSSERYSQETQKIEEMKKANKGLLPQFSQMQGIDSKVSQALQQQFYIGDVTVLGTEYVGPEVGADLRQKATLAIAWSMAGILVYLWFRFEFTWSLSIIVCILHDVLITLGMVSLFNREISLNVIAAFLTLVGYSMNDTIVVYDRVRDNLRSMRSQPLEAVFNASINQTLGRTILTSGTVFIVVLVLYFFGGEVINDFAFCLVVGVITGTFSTIYIASALVIITERFFGKKKRVQPAKAKAAQKVS
jgi:preprotein translocase subunit SecF